MSVTLLAAGCGAAQQGVASDTGSSPSTSPTSAMPAPPTDSASATPTPTTQVTTETVGDRPLTATVKVLTQEGYTATLDVSVTRPELVVTTINDRPGEGTIDLYNDSSGTVTVTNTTEGRNNPINGISVNLWDVYPKKSAVCRYGVGDRSDFEAETGDCLLNTYIGATEPTELPPGGQQTFDSLDSTGATYGESGVDEKEAAKVLAALKQGPIASLLGVSWRNIGFSYDYAGITSRHCAFSVAKYERDVDVKLTEFTESACEAVGGKLKSD